ncbi:hypothetical protein J4221_01275 [Candidatus Pacearchaeota archaeon]|nr:hypothetical protein [Candidatus Pacearchaeota archaeon]
MINPLDVLYLRHKIAAQYDTTTIHIATGLEKLLNGEKNVHIPRGYVDTAISLFQLAHSGFANLDFISKHGHRDLEEIKAMTYVTNAYAMINPEYNKDDASRELKVREGLFLTECIPVLLKNQAIPHNSIALYEELRQVYKNLFRIAEEENQRQFYEDTDDD